MTNSVLLIDEAESKIRLIVRDGYLKGENELLTRRKVAQVIQSVIYKMPDAMKENARIGLSALYDKARRTMIVLSPAEVYLLAASQKVLNETPVHPITKTEAEQATKDRALLYGVPNKTFSKDYIKKQVRPILDRLSRQYATVDRQSLTNKAEMQARFDFHTQQREELEAQGAKLVIISVHADCSDRCRPFQGKVFSLDGTYGTTDDGRKFEPLENATNIQARSKSGKVYPYFNGLFGFNCRHYMVAYKDGLRFPKPSAEVERREYAITEKQREMERAIRSYKNKAEAARGIDTEMYRQNKARAKQLNDKYIEFSKNHGRAYIPWRTKIL